MNFELTPQQKAVQQSARQFAQTVLQETVLEDDAAGRFPEEAYKKMGEMGFDFWFSWFSVLRLSLGLF